MFSTIKESKNFDPKNFEVGKCTLSDLNTKISSCSQKGYLRVKKGESGKYTLQTWNPNILVRILSNILFLIRLPSTLKVNHAAAAYLKILEKNEKQLKGNEKSTLDVLDKLKHRIDSKAFPKLYEQLNKQYKNVVKLAEDSAQYKPVKVKIDKVLKEMEKNDRLAHEVIIETSRPHQAKLEEMYNQYLSIHADEMKTVIRTKDGQILVSSKVYSNKKNLNLEIKKKDPTAVMINKNSLEQLKKNSYPNLEYEVKSSKNAATLRAVIYKEIGLDHKLYLETLDSHELLDAFRSKEKSIIDDINKEMARRVSIDPTFARRIIKEELGLEYPAAFEHVTTSYVLSEIENHNPTLSIDLLIFVLASPSCKLDTTKILKAHLSCNLKKYQPTELNPNQLQLELENLVKCQNKAQVNFQKLSKMTTQWETMVKKADCKIQLGLFWANIQAPSEIYSSDHFKDMYVQSLSENELKMIAQRLKKPFRFINFWMKKHFSTHEDRIKCWNNPKYNLIHLINIHNYDAKADFFELAEIKASGIFEYDPWVNQQIVQKMNLIKVTEIKTGAQKWTGAMYVDDVLHKEDVVDPIPANALLTSREEWIRLPEVDFEEEFDRTEYLASCANLPERITAYGTKKGKDNPYSSLKDEELITQYLFANDKRSGVGLQVVNELEVEMIERIKKNADFFQVIASHPDFESDSDLVKMAKGIL